MNDDEGHHWEKDYPIIIIDQSMMLVIFLADRGFVDHEKISPVRSDCVDFLI